MKQTPSEGNNNTPVVTFPAHKRLILRSYQVAEVNG